MDPEIVGGIAGSAVSYLLLKLDAFVTRELNLKKNINRALRDLGIELRSIEILMRESASKEDPGDNYTGWIQEVRDQAYAIEYVLDLFKLHQEKPWRHFLSLHPIDNLINDIEGSLQRIERTRKRYSTITFTRTNSGYYTDHHVRMAPLFNLDTVVGIEEPTEKLVTWALEEKQRLEVMFVVGMTGLGKTTLVHSVYESERVKDHCFEVQNHT